MTQIIQHPAASREIPRLVPMNYLKAMRDSVLKDLADRIGRVNQSLDPRAPFPPLTYDQLGQIDPQFQIRLNDAARCAIRWCVESQHHDAELRTRQALAPRLYGREYNRLEVVEVALVNDLATLVVATLRLHYTGVMSPICEIEREELSDPQEAV